MKTFVAPNGRIVNVPEGRFLVYGLSDEEIRIVKNSISSDEYEVYVSDDVTDILAIDQKALIINPAAISEEDRALIVDHYTALSLKGHFAETVFWIGYPKPPSHLRTKFFCDDDFGVLSYILSGSKRKPIER